MGRLCPLGSTELSHPQNARACHVAAQIALVGTVILGDLRADDRLHYLRSDPILVVVRQSAVPLERRSEMAWKTPRIVEVPVGMEINMYACAARK